MKLVLMFCLAGAALAVSGQTDSPKAKAPATAAPAEVKIPAGAVKTEDGSFKFTDADGKKWIYRNTPFGVAKSEDKVADPTLTPFGRTRAPEKPVEAARTPVAGNIPAQTKPCKPDDASPAGTIVDGYKKVIERTPFGVACRWNAEN